MNIQTCNGCPLRKVDGERCKILQSKLDAVKGAGLTSIRFRCAVRLSLFRPGDEVAFSIYVPGEEEILNCLGIVMDMRQTRVLVYVIRDEVNEQHTEAPIVLLQHARIRKTGKLHPICIYCGRPQGVEIKMLDGGLTDGRQTYHDWECSRWLDDGLDSRPAPCQFEIAGKGDSAP